MQRSITLPGYKIHFKMLGIDTGGFSEKYTEKAIADLNTDMLRTFFGSKTSTLMRAQMHSEIKDVAIEHTTQNCDALITTDLFHALIMKPADCIPLVLFSTKQPLLALVHGSRSSLDENIIEKTMNRLESYGARPEDVSAYIGPSIKHSSYILPSSIVSKLTHPSWDKFIRYDDSQISMDIVGFTSYELVRLGLKPNNISISRINTAAHSDYFSNYAATRRGTVQGRNGMVVIMV